MELILDIPTKELKDIYLKIKSSISGWIKPLLWSFDRLILDFLVVVWVFRGTSFSV